MFGITYLWHPHYTTEFRSNTVTLVCFNILLEWIIMCKPNRPALNKDNKTVSVSLVYSEDFVAFMKKKKSHKLLPPLLFSHIWKP